MKLVTLFLLLSSTILGQTEIQPIKVKKNIEDTIDYTYMIQITNWNITKILDNNVKTQRPCLTDLWFKSPVDTLMTNRFYANSKINITDTIVKMGWYIDKNSKCLSANCDHGAFFWKLKLNRNSNVMVMDRLLCPQDKQPSRLFFKVIKCSFYEIILEDMSIKSVKRHYYFQKR